MSRARLRVCSEPRCPTLSPRPRCPEHQAQVEKHQRRTTPTKVHRGPDIERRRAAVRAHRATHGDWCPGYERAPHAASDLTADHVHDLQAGGAWDGDLAVLCRSCNSRKARRVQLALRAASIHSPNPPKPDTKRAGREAPGGYPLRAPSLLRRRGGLKKVRRVQDDPGAGADDQLG